jgi:hypothetical protein
MENLIKRGRMLVMEVGTAKFVPPTVFVPFPDPNFDFSSLAGVPLHHS